MDGGKYEVDAHCNDEYVFQWACANGHLDIAKWMCQVFSINVSADDKFAFTYACASGHLKIAKWLVNKHSINIHANNESAFAQACANARANVVTWFEQELGSSMRYFCHNNQPYIINSDEIKNWQHCEILNCPIAYLGKFNETAVLEKLAHIPTYKSAASC